MNFKNVKVKPEIIDKPAEVGHEGGQIGVPRKTLPSQG